MINFIFQIITSIFIGCCFVYIAKRYQKSETKYFFLGFGVCFAIRIIYLVIYGFLMDFKIDKNYNNHSNYSIVLSLIISYFVFTSIRKKLKKENLKTSNINEIGEK